MCFGYFGLGWLHSKRQLNNNLGTSLDVSWKRCFWYHLDGGIIMKYYTKPIAVTAWQWFIFIGNDSGIEQLDPEHPEHICSDCKQILGNHGWISYPENENIKRLVCPGNFIVSTPRDKDFIQFSPESFERQFLDNDQMKNFVENMGDKYEL